MFSNPLLIKDKKICNKLSISNIFYSVYILYSLLQNIADSSKYKYLTGNTNHILLFNININYLNAQNIVGRKYKIVLMIIMY
jgi:hypothetical protein